MDYSVRHRSDSHSYTHILPDTPLCTDSSNYFQSLSSNYQSTNPPSEVNKITPSHIRNSLQLPLSPIAAANFSPSLSSSSSLSSSTSSSSPSISYPSPNPNLDSTHQTTLSRTDHNSPIVYQGQQFNQPPSLSSQHPSSSLFEHNNTIGHCHIVNPSNNFKVNNLSSSSLPNNYYNRTSSEYTIDKLSFTHSHNHSTPNPQDLSRDQPHNKPCSISTGYPSTRPLMPPTTQFRQGSTSLGSSSTWEPYPKSSHMSRGESAHKPSLSFSFPYSLPSAMSALKMPTASTPTLLPSMITEDLNLEEISCDTVSNLIKQTLESNEDRRDILLLDMRPAVCHAVSSIVAAVSVSVPNMLLKRPMYSLGMVSDQLTSEREVEAFSNWRRYSNIVVFDATGSIPVKGTPMYCMALKFKREGYNGTLAYIHGGFNAFALEYASLCCDDDGTNLDRTTKLTTGYNSINIPSKKSAPDSNTSPTRSRLHLGSLPTTKLKPTTASASTICQTPMIENPNINPLFENVRLAMGLNTNITEEVAVRLPSRFPMETIRNQLPAWLLDSIHEEKGKTILSEYFQKIEIAEKKRLAILMAPQEMMCGRTTELSICAGLEKGYKNRYNHVWPFDHTRVRVKEYDAGGDDYINASFLRPPFGQKSYIVTQGPLPDTFEDFWKVMWEQDSRVIVMLTREFEMGRIKCHRYWPTSDNPIMNLGPLQVTFVSESQPDVTNGNILVCKIKLNHNNRPDMPEQLITHIQYTGWPDFGVPESPMEVLKVIDIADANNIPTTAGPMVVHCSAGCGRTGAFCVIDAVLSELKSNPDKKIFDLLTPKASSTSDGSSQTSQRNDPMKDLVYVTVNRFREQRLSMVQCLRQYVFCYEAIIWHLAIELSKAQGVILSLSPKTTNPQSQKLISSCSLLSKGNAPITTSNEEFSFFG